MKRLLPLSLAILIGTSLADTTDNLVNQQGQLDHNSTYYYTQSDEVYYIPQDADWRNPESIDWSVDVRSFDNAVGCYSNCIDDTATIALHFYDEEGSYLTSTGPGSITLDYDGGAWSGWINYSGSYSDDQYLSEIDKIQFVVGGKDEGYWGGQYGPQFQNASLTFEYNPVEESIIIEVEQEMFKLIEDLEQGHIEMEEFTKQFDEVKTEMEEDFKEHDIEMETHEVFDEFKEDIKEAKDETKEAKEDSEVSDSVDKDVDSKQETKTEKKSKEQKNTLVNNYGFPIEDKTAQDALEVVELIESIEAPSMMQDVVNLGEYVAVSYADSVELEDNDDWYQNQSFYETTGFLPDSGILAGYSNKLLNDNKDWYGSDNQFY